MAHWRVRDVMTTQVITARDEESVGEIAAVLAAHRISAVPIVDRFDVVVGVVSWSDLRDRLDIGEPDNAPRRGRPRRWMPPRPRWSGGAAVQVMTAPPVTIRPEAWLPAAARLMYRRNVGRLLVVDGADRLRGIVTRTDLLKVHARLDAVIRDEVMQRVLRRTLMLEPGAVQATVDDGAVTLTGHVVDRSTAVTAAGLAETVTGVTGVIDRLTFDVDDSVPVAAATSEPVHHDPLRGWCTGRQPRPLRGGAAAGGLPSHPPCVRTTAASAAHR